MREIFLVLMTVLFSLTTSSAQDLPSKELIAKFVKASEENRPSDIRAMEARIRTQSIELAAMKKAPPKVRKPASEIETFAAGIASDKEKVAELKAGDLFFPVKMPKGKLEIGNLGVLHFPVVHVVNVINKSELLGNISVYEGDQPWRPTINSSPIDFAEARAAAFATRAAELRRQTVPVISENVTVWFVNVPTAGMTDKTNAGIHQVFYVSGTKQYKTTAGGIRTVFVLTAVDDYGQKKKPN